MVGCVGEGLRMTAGGGSVAEWRRGRKVLALRDVGIGSGRNATGEVGK